MTAESQQNRCASRRGVLLGVGMAGIGLAGCSTAAVPYDSNEAGVAPGAQAAANSRRDRPGNRREIRLQHPEGGMHEPMREVAVVGQEQQPFTVGVEPPDVEEPLRPVGDEIAHGRPAACVTHRAEHTPRLVQGQVDEVVTYREPVPVDMHHG